MAYSALEKILLDQLDQLSMEQQQRVLEFARALAMAKSRGVPGSTLTRFSGAIDSDDLEAMAVAIEDGCEKVSPDEW